MTLTLALGLALALRLTLYVRLSPDVWVRHAGATLACLRCDSFGVRPGLASMSCPDDVRVAVRILGSIVNQSRDSPNGPHADQPSAFARVNVCFYSFT